MKALLLLASAAFLFGIQAQAIGSSNNGSVAQNNGYQCKQTASGVCAKKLSTGQCTHLWSYDDSSNPMFHCKKFIGLNVSNFNKANYFCRDHGGYVCAASKKTNQCTHSWDQDDHNDPMWSCQKYLGIVKSNFDKSNFRCKQTASGVCAQSKKTGQCTHLWSSDDGGNPMWQCQNWLKK